MPIKEKPTPAAQTILYCDTINIYLYNRH